MCNQFVCESQTEMQNLPATRLRPRPTSDNQLWIHNMIGYVLALKLWSSAGMPLLATVDAQYQRPTADCPSQDVGISLSYDMCLIIYPPSTVY